MRYSLLILILACASGIAGTPATFGPPIQAGSSLGALRTTVGPADGGGGGEATAADGLIDWSLYVGVQGKPTRTTIYTNLPAGSAAPINTAIQHCPANQIVTLSNQTYSLSEVIVMKSGVTLRGQGTNTCLVPDQGVVAIKAAPTVSYTAVNIHSGSWKGSTNISVVSAISDISEDSLMLITATNDSNFMYPFGLETGTPTVWAGDDPDTPVGNRLRADITRLYSIANGTNLVLKHPLTFDYTNTPARIGYQANWQTHPYSLFGIENLAINGASNQVCIQFDGVYNAWVSNVHFRIFADKQSAVNGFYNASFVTVQHCAFAGYPLQT